MAVLSLEHDQELFSGWDWQKRSIIMTPLNGRVGPDRHENRPSEIVQALFGRESRVLTPSIQQLQLGWDRDNFMLI